MQVSRNLARKYGARIAVAGSALLSSFVALAQATDPATVATGAVTGAQTTGTTVALAILSMVVAIWAIFKVIRFFGSK